MPVYGSKGVLSIGYNEHEANWRIHSLDKKGLRGFHGSHLSLWRLEDRGLRHSQSLPGVKRARPVGEVRAPSQTCVRRDLNSIRGMGWVGWQICKNTLILVSRSSRW